MPSHCQDGGKPHSDNAVYQAQSYFKSKYGHRLCYTVGRKPFGSLLG